MHDEAYADVHLGAFGINLNFFKARICFRGGAKYALNILKVCIALNVNVNNIPFEYKNDKYTPFVIIRLWSDYLCLAYVAIFIIHITYKL